MRTTGPFDGTRLCARKILIIINNVAVCESTNILYYYHHFPSYYIVALHLQRICTSPCLHIASTLRKFTVMENPILRNFLICSLSAFYLKFKIRRRYKILFFKQFLCSTHCIREHFSEILTRQHRNSNECIVLKFLTLCTYMYKQATSRLYGSIIMGLKGIDYVNFKIIYILWVTYKNVPIKQY